MSGFDKGFEGDNIPPPESGLGMIVWGILIAVIVVGAAFAMYEHRVQNVAAAIATQQGGTAAGVTPGEIKAEEAVPSTSTNTNPFTPAQSSMPNSGSTPQTSAPSQ